MPTDKPLVTVIIPVYSQPNLLFKTIDSVLNQIGVTPCRIIVVDDHSPDRINHLVSQRYPQVTVIRNRTNLKSGPSRNQALKFIRTKYVAFLDYDDIWLPDFLKTSLSFLHNSDCIGSTVLPIPVFDKFYPISQQIKKRFLLLIRDLLYFVFYNFNNKILPHTAFYLGQISHQVFKSAAIKGLKFDPNYNFGGEDWKFMLEVMDRGSIGIIPARLVRYRYHPASSIQKPINVLNKWKSYKQLFPEIVKRGLHGPMIEFLKYYIKTFETK